MPKNGAYWLSEFLGHEIAFSCKVCDRTASIAASELLSTYGDKPMPDLRYDLAEVFECFRGPNAQFSETCKLAYDRGGNEVLAANEKSRGQTAVADVPGWLSLAAMCPTCGRIKPIDRRAIVRKFGKTMTLDELAAALRCACGKKGATVLSKSLPR